MAKQGNSKLTIRLPQEGKLVSYSLSAKSLPLPQQPIAFSRLAYAAPHIVIKPLAYRTATADRPLIDWDATLGGRQKLWDKGFAVAEAMDTSQRGMGLDWQGARELISRSLSLAKTRSSLDRIACGAGTDQLVSARSHNLKEITNAYREQIEFIEKLGGSCILMASRALAATARHKEDYLSVYSELLSQMSNPCILHWLGDMFDPQLKAYWGSDDLYQAAETVIEIITSHQTKVKGIKISLLDESLEISIRNRLPAGVHLFTGDDLNYPTLIKGDKDGYSDALLGVFTAIAAPACLALQYLAADDEKSYDQVLNPTLPLAHEIFTSPTRFYKAGIGFIAWLNNHQQHFIMPAGLQAMRTIDHYGRLFRYADQCGVLEDPPLGVKRMNDLLKLYGIDG